MVTKVIRGASMPKDKLNAYGAGLLRLSELNIPAVNFKACDIEFIGQCSISRKKCIIGKVGESWTIKGREKELERKSGARYGGAKFEEHYAITGKRSVCIYKDPNRDRSKALSLITAQELCNAFKGRPTRKHAAKPGLRERLNFAARMEK